MADENNSALVSLQQYHALNHRVAFRLLRGPRPEALYEIGQALL